MASKAGQCYSKGIFDKINETRIEAVLCSIFSVIAPFKK